MGRAETSGRQMSAAPAIELRGISKAFGPVQANKDISISVAPGSIHGIIGENGAGKSTLMSILYGFYKADKGEIFIHGVKTEIPDSLAAIKAGIGMVFQHFKLVENFTVLENVILGAEDGKLLKPSLAILPAWTFATIRRSAIISLCRNNGCRQQKCRCC